MEYLQLDNMIAQLLDKDDESTAIAISGIGGIGYVTYQTHRPYY